MAQRAPPITRQEAAANYQMFNRLFDMTLPGTYHYNLVTRKVPFDSYIGEQAGKKVLSLSRPVHALADTHSLLSDSLHMRQIDLTVRQTGMLHHDILSAMITGNFDTDRTIEALLDTKDQGLPQFSGSAGVLPQSPDAPMLSPEGRIIVIDYKSAFTNRSTALEAVYTQAVGKYTAMMETARHTSNWTVGCIAVGRTCLVTSFPIRGTDPQSIADELIGHYNCAREAQRKAEGEGILQADDWDELHSLLASFQSVDSPLPRSDPDATHITEELLASLTQSIDYEAENQKLCNHIIARAKEIGIKRRKEATKVFGQKWEEKVNSYSVHHPPDCDYYIARTPMILPTVSQYSGLPAGLSGNPSVLGKIWGYSIGCRKPDAAVPGYQDCCQAESETTVWTTRISDAGRCSFQLTEEMIAYLASRGIKKKEAATRPDRDLDDGTPIYPVDLDLTRFHSFMRTDNGVFDVTAGSVDPVSQQVQSLRRRAENIAGGCFDLTNSFISTLLRTKVGQALAFLSSLSSVLSAMHSQHDKLSSFRIRRVPGFVAWVLVRALGPSGNLWYSILSECEPFHTDFNCGVSLRRGWRATNFECADRHKIDHLLFSFEKFAAQVRGLGDSFRYSTSELITMLQEGTFESSAVGTSCKVFLASHLDDKKCNSDALLKLRYGQVNIMNPSQFRQSPTLVLDKFPLPRTPLVVWVYQSWKAYCEVQTLRPPVLVQISEQGEGVKDRDLWDNLISWIDHRPIPHFEAAIQLSYAGVNRNKAETAGRAGLFKIYSKVIECELDLRGARKDHMGLSEPPDLNDLRLHEFSPNFVRCAMASVRERFLTPDCNVEVRSHLLETAKELLKTSALDLATFRASTREPKTDPSQTDQQARNRGRQRALQGVVDMLDAQLSDHTSAYANIPLLFEQLSKYGFWVDLFEKAQLTDVREIFVLTMRARMLARLIELLFKPIADALPNEQITEGAGKLDTNLRFDMILARASEGKLVEVSNDSTDKTTWCQLFVMPVLMAAVVEVFPPAFHRPIATALNHIVDKKLMVVPFVLDKFGSHPNVTSYSSPAVNEHKSQWLGTSPHHDVCNTGAMYVKNMSNFMQGILGLSFGTVHAGAQLKVLEYTRSVFEQMKRLQIMEQTAEYIVTAQTSSDDAGQQKAVVFEEPAAAQLASTFLSLSTFMFEAASPLFCARESEKKNANDIKVPLYEFNSDFKVNGIVIRPLCKFAYVQFALSIDDTIYGRMTSFASSRNDLLPAGSSLETVDVVQHLQLRAHYISLGAAHSPTWHHLLRSLLAKPVPHLGFFLLEPSQTVGIFGHQSALLRYLQSPFGGYEMSFLRKHGDVFTDESTQAAAYLRVSRHQKYQRLKQDVGVPVDWRTQNDHNHILYYKRSDELASDAEVRWALYRKVMSPGVAAGLEFDTAEKVVCTGYYVAHSPCIMMRVDGELKKVSLCRALHLAPASEQIPEVALDFMVPVRHTIREIIDAVDDTADMPMAVAKEGIRRFHKSPMPSGSSRMYRPLEAVVRCHWYGYSDMSSTESLRLFNNFRQVFPYLSDDHESTFAASPFDDRLAMADYIKSITPKSHTLQAICSTRSATLSSIVYTLVTRCRARGHIIMGTEERSTAFTIGRLALLMTSPVATTQVLDNIQRRIKCQTVSSPAESVVVGHGKSEGAARLVLDYAHTRDPNRLFEMIMSSRTLDYLWWEHRQEKAAFGSGATYAGFGVLSGCIGGTPVRVFVQGSRVTSVSCPSREAITSIGPSLCRRLRRLNLTMGREGSNPVSGVILSASGVPLPSSHSGKTNHAAVSFEPLADLSLPEGGDFSIHIHSLVSGALQVWLHTDHGYLLADTIYLEARDIRPLEPPPGSLKPADWWIAYREYPYEMSYSLMNQAQVRLETDTSEPLSNWVRETLRERLIYRGVMTRSSALGVSGTVAEVDEPEPLAQEVDLMDLDIMGALTTLFGSGPLPEPTQPPDPSTEITSELVARSLRAFEPASMDPEVGRVENVAGHHPFWDALIDRVREIHPGGIRSLLNRSSTSRHALIVSLVEMFAPPLPAGGEEAPPDIHWSHFQDD
jgi:hypothetical protein